MASGCGAANIAAHFVLADSGCAAPFVPTCCCCGNTPAGSRGRTICCSSKRTVILCSKVRMQADGCGSGSAPAA